MIVILAICNYTVEKNSLFSRHWSIYYRLYNREMINYRKATQFALRYVIKNRCATYLKVILLEYNLINVIIIIKCKLTREEKKSSACAQSVKTSFPIVRGIILKTTRW